MPKKGLARSLEKCFAKYPKKENEFNFKCATSHHYVCDNCYFGLMCIRYKGHIA